MTIQCGLFDSKYIYYLSRLEVQRRSSAPFNGANANPLLRVVPSADEELQKLLKRRLSKIPSEALESGGSLSSGINAQVIPSDGNAAQTQPSAKNPPSASIFQTVEDTGGEVSSAGHGFLAYERQLQHELQEFDQDLQGIFEFRITTSCILSKRTWAFC